MGEAIPVSQEIRPPGDSPPPSQKGGDIPRIFGGCLELEIPDLFLVLNMISHSFAISAHPYIILYLYL